MSKKKRFIGKKMKYHTKKYPAAVAKRREDVRRQRAEAKAKIKSPLKTRSLSKRPPITHIWSPATEITAATSNSRPLSDKETMHTQSASIISTPSLSESKCNLLSYAAKELFIQPMSSAALPVLQPQTIIIAQPATYALTTVVYPNYPRDNGSSHFQQIISDAKELATTTGWTVSYDKKPSCTCNCNKTYPAEPPI